jgi:hypothetical protein
MATTTNYGWDTPDDTDLVKDGADAMRELGQDIDTSLFGITGGKNVGLVHINTTTFTASTSVVFTNVFTTAYDNYRVEITYTASATNELRLQMANGGTGDSAATGYSYGLNYISGTATAFDRGSNGTSSAVIAFANTVGGTYGISMDVYSPKLTAQTVANLTGTQYNNVSHVTTFGGFTRSATTAYDGMVLFPASGNITGTVRIYGYRNA